MHNLLFSIWFFLPAGFANASPVFATRIKFLSFLKKPIDFGYKLRGKPILGENKTWVGLIFAVFIASLVMVIQIILYKNFSWVRSLSVPIDYSDPFNWLLGPLIGFGALFGDAVESFFKRQSGVKPGSSWFPFDQIDYILGGILLSLLVVRLTLLEYGLIIIVWLIIHVLGSYVGYLFRLKSKPI